MAENFDLLVWRANVADAHGDIVTAKALQEMADALPFGMGVPLNFDIRQIVGKVVAPWIKDDELYVNVSISDPDVIAAIKSNRVALRPMFRVDASHVDDDEAIWYVDSIRAAHVSITTDPMPLPGDVG